MRLSLLTVILFVQFPNNGENYAFMKISHYVYLKAQNTKIHHTDTLEISSHSSSSFFFRLQEPFNILSQNRNALKSHHIYQQKNIYNDQWDNPIQTKLNERLNVWMNYEKIFLILFWAKFVARRVLHLIWEYIHIVFWLGFAWLRCA